MDKKCAPSKKYEDGSCIKIDALKDIAENFNNTHNTKILLNQDKKDLVEDLENHFKEKYKCKDQICWLNQKLVKKIKDEDLDKFTFRPEGPSERLEWLSTTNINDVIEQYEKKHEDFLFLGAVPYDFQELQQLELGNLNFDDLINGKLNEDYKLNKKINKFGMVINLDPHYKSGSHWVALYSDFEKNQIYYFDSFGKKPRQKIKEFINKIIKYMYQKKYNIKLPLNKLIRDIKIKKKSELIKSMAGFDIRYNSIQHQKKNTECGVYSINFIIRLANGETFDDITKKITRDDDMNDCRTQYFNNVK